MKISSLDRRVTLQELAETVSASGEVLRDYADKVTLWARVEPKTGTEGQDADRNQASSGFVITIRYRSDITTRYRLKYSGITYDITSVTEVGRREALELQIERHV